MTRLFTLVFLLVLLTASLPAPVLAQGGAQLGAQDYLRQCLRFYAGGDFETARQSCQAALQLQPNLAAAELALARVEIALGQDAAAEPRLRRLQAGAGLSREDSAEVPLLLTELMLRQGRLAEAASALAAAERRLQEPPDQAREGRRLFLTGKLAEARGEYRTALEFYRAATAAQPRVLDYHLADARLRLNLGDPHTPQRDLLAYQAFVGPQGASAELFSLVGHAKWAAGELGEAAHFLEQAVAARSSSERQALERDRRALIFVYYGQGDWMAGELLLRNALRRDGILAYGLSLLLPWLLLLLGLLGLHLLGESRIDASSGFEMVQRPEPWTTRNVYSGLGVAFAAAALAALGYGYAVFNNWLAFATPLQAADVRACYLTVLALALIGLALRRVWLNGWEPFDILLGRRAQLGLGIGLGLGLGLLVVLYLLYAPEIAWLQGFYLDYARLNLWLVVAVVAFPLSELFFRPFAVTALARRYSPELAVAIAAVLFALVVGMPLPLVLLIGLALGESYRRTRNGLVPLVAQWALHLSLLLGVAYSGWLRGLFF